MYKGVRWHERNGKWEARIFDSAAQKQVQSETDESPHEAFAASCDYGVLLTVIVIVRYTT